MPMIRCCVTHGKRGDMLDECDFPGCNKPLIWADSASAGDPTWGGPANWTRQPTYTFVVKKHEHLESNSTHMSAAGKRLFQQERDEEAVLDRITSLGSSKPIKKDKLSGAKHRTTQRIKRQEAMRKIFSFESMGQTSKGVEVTEGMYSLRTELKEYQYRRTIVSTPGGIRRRNSWGLVNPEPRSDEDIQDWVRDMLGGAATPVGYTLNRVVKIAVLSTHGQDDKKMCDGYQNLHKLTLPHYDTRYQNAMSLNHKSASHNVTSWIELMLRGRARPDVIVLLEGHVTRTTGDEVILLEGEPYFRKTSPIDDTGTDHLQNMTGWIRAGVDPAVLQLNIQNVKVTAETGSIETLMGVISHRIEGRCYYELVCHLPASHYSTRRCEHGKITVENWYKENLDLLTENLCKTGDVYGGLLNVMGDTNFKTAYDAKLSPAPTFGGDLMAPFNKGFPASSDLDARFMRQMCNPKFVWDGALIRVHRASYLNHIPVRDGLGMGTAWGIDHPSFMSYTSIYNRPL